MVFAENTFSLQNGAQSNILVFPLLLTPAATKSRERAKRYQLRAYSKKRMASHFVLIRPPIFSSGCTIRLHECTMTGELTTFPSSIVGSSSFFLPLSISHSFVHAQCNAVPCIVFVVVVLGGREMGLHGSFSAGH